MHTFYAPFSETDSQILLPVDEKKHLKVLRLNPNEEFGITNGKGLFAFCEGYDFISGIASVKSIVKEYNELNFGIHLFCALIQDKTRLELIVEKSTELGVNKITFFKSVNSQKIRINEDRLLKKAISAMKQSNKSILPKISIYDDLVSLEKYKSQEFYLAEKNSKNSQIDKASNINLLIGPEGGFSTQEFEYFADTFILKNVNLGKAILRTETACISLISRANVS